MRQANRAAHPESWKPGDMVPESGIYAVIHGDRKFNNIEAIFIVDQVFPACKDCGENVRFQLLRNVPYIFEDEDFRRAQG